MAQENQEALNDVKVEPATNDSPSNGQETKNDHRGGDRFGGSGERFGRGGRFGGQRGRGGRGDNQRGDGGRNFDNRRSRGGGFGGNRSGPKQDHDGNDDEEGFRGDRGDFRGGRQMRGPDERFLEKMQSLSGPTFDLPAIDLSEKKFNGRTRLYVGNIGNEMSEEELIEIFKPYGETAEVFINKEKNFGFIKLDYRSNAEKAKRELDGTTVKSRNLKIRFAPNSATLKVKNLSPYVTNELLHYAFSVFGEIERAHVSVDERGKPTGEGIVDFARKGSALHAVRKCTSGCLFLTQGLRPCVVELFELIDDIDGYPEKNLFKKSQDYQKEREVGPRFASAGSFEHEYGMRWKQLYDLHKQKEDALKKELSLEKEKLEAQMEYAKYEHETEMLREQLRSREMDKERQKREWEMKQKQVEEERLRTEELMRRSQEDMETRLAAQQEEVRRRQQENRLFMQAQSLSSLLDQQDQTFESPNSYSQRAGAHDDVGSDPTTFMSSYERGSRYDNDSSRGSSKRGHWVNDSRHNDNYTTKRQRY